MSHYEDTFVMATSSSIRSFVRTTPQLILGGTFHWEMCTQRRRTKWNTPAGEGQEEELQKKREFISRNNSWGFLEFLISAQEGWSWFLDFCIKFAFNRLCISISRPSSSWLFRSAFDEEDATVRSILSNLIDDILFSHHESAGSPVSYPSGCVVI